MMILMNISTIVLSLETHVPE